MNESRFKSIYSGLSSVAQKVYDAVPIGEAWTSAQIQAELFRRGGNADGKTVQGCLSSLVQSKLVTEPKRGTFQRVEISEKKPVPPPKAVIDKGMQMTAAVKSKASVADRIGELSGRARSVADLMRELADDIDLIAIEVEDEIAESGADSQKLKQLQSLLKSLS